MCGQEGGDGGRLGREGERGEGEEEKKKNPFATSCASLPPLVAKRIKTCVSTLWQEDSKSPAMNDTLTLTGQESEECIRKELLKATPGFTDYFIVYTGKGRPVLSFPPNTTSTSSAIDLTIEGVEVNKKSIKQLLKIFTKARGLKFGKGCLIHKDAFTSVSVDRLVDIEIGNGCIVQPGALVPVAAFRELQSYRVSGATEEVAKQFCEHISSKKMCSLQLSDQKFQKWPLEARRNLATCVRKFRSSLINLTLGALAPEHALDENLMKVIAHGRYPALKQLNVWDQAFISDRILATFISNCPLLASVDFCGCGFNMETIEALYTRKHLEIVRVSGYRDPVTGELFPCVEFLFEFLAIPTVSLNISGVKGDDRLDLRDEDIKAAVPNPKLEKLVIRSEGDYRAGNKTLTLLGKTCPDGQLKDLEIPVDTAPEVTSLLPLLALSLAEGASLDLDAALVPSRELVRALDAKSINLSIDPDLYDGIPLNPASIDYMEAETELKSITYVYLQHRTELQDYTCLDPLILRVLPFMEEQGDLRLDFEPTEAVRQAAQRQKVSVGTVW